MAKTYGTAGRRASRRALLAVVLPAVVLLAAIALGWVPMTSVLAVPGPVARAAASRAATTTPITAATPLQGNDISWPQCPVGVGSPRPGQGQPMPPATARILLIGLTDGVGFVANPCLAAQVAWARAHHTYTAAYANSGYPSAAEIAGYGGSGPWPGTDALSRLRNTGYAEARFNVATMRRTNLATPHVWVDVEPNLFKPWSTSFAGNKAVIDGTLRGYTDSGYTVGFYSVPSLWDAVLGPGVAYRLPEWRTAGARGYAEALSRCSGPSFNGGPAVLAQWWTTNTDYDLLCPAYAASLTRYFSRYAAAVPFGDYDGDGRTDLALFRPGTGTWYVRGLSAAAWGSVGDLAVPGDYDGDGRADLAVWRPSTGVWYVRGGLTVEWGVQTDRPVTGDFDGDGRADPAVYRPGTQTWWIRGSAPVRWGAPGDVPVPADYNGDGRTDIAMWRPSTGTWYVRGIAATRYGIPGDQPVAADYNGDGRADLALWRPSTGTWYVRGVAATRYGIAGDLPVPGDYDGDGRTEIAMWRPSTGTWYVRGLAATRWGVASDLPVRRQPTP